MIYVKLDGEDILEVHYMPFDSKYGLGKSEKELLETGILVENYPEPPYVEGKVGYTKYVDGEFVFKYEDIEETNEVPLEDRVAELEDIVLMLTL